MSSRALANNIIEPAAADEASHADFNSPAITACRRALTALSARFSALCSNACAGFSSSGTASTARRFELSCSRSFNETRTAGSDPASFLISSRLRCAAARVSKRAHRFLIGAETAQALPPSVARKLKLPCSVQLYMNLSEQCFHHVGTHPPQLNVLALGGGEHFLSIPHAGSPRPRQTRAAAPWRRALSNVYRRPLPRRASKRPTDAWTSPGIPR